MISPAAETLVAHGAIAGCAKILQVEPGAIRLASDWLHLIETREIHMPVLTRFLYEFGLE